MPPLVQVPLAEMEREQIQAVAIAFALHLCQGVSL